MMLIKADNTILNVQNLCHAQFERGTLFLHFAEGSDGVAGKAVVLKDKEAQRVWDYLTLQAIEV